MVERTSFVSDKTEEDLMDAEKRAPQLDDLENARAYVINNEKSVRERSISAIRVSEVTKIVPLKHSVSEFKLKEPSKANTMACTSETAFDASEFLNQTQSMAAEPSITEKDTKNRPVVDSEVTNSSPLIVKQIIGDD